jgi:uncharacterized protein YjiS (DUF1127 family)
MPIQDLSFFTSTSRPASADGHSQLARMVVARAKAMRTEFLRELWRQLRSWYQKRMALAQLRALDDAALKDIGLHRSGIESALDRAATVANPQKRLAFAEKPHFWLQRTGAAVR